MIVKKCTKCGVDKEIVHFYKRTANCYHAECKECLKNRSDSWNKKNGKKRWQTRKKLFQKIEEKHGFGMGTVTRYGIELSEKVYEMYNGKCDICGSEKKLTFHHIDGKGIHLYEKGEKMNNELGNIKLLCRSCHGRIHSRDGKK